MMANRTDPILRLTTDTMMTRAACAIGKLDLYGLERGVSMMSVFEVEAMGALLAVMGLTPIYPGEQPTMPMFVSCRTKSTPEEET